MAPRWAFFAVNKLLCEWVNDMWRQFFGSVVVGRIEKVPFEEDFKRYADVWLLNAGYKKRDDKKDCELQAERPTGRYW